MKSDSFSRATRRRIVELLRREPLTIQALAERLGLTASGVRVHVGALEHDGFVRRAGLVRGPNRPATIYALAPGVDAVLCTAYVAFAGHLVRVMGEALPASQLAALMRRTGQQLATSYGRPTGPLEKRAEAVSELLNELGALTEVEPAPGGVTIRGHDCPLAAAVEGSAESCRAMESFVAQLVRAPVRERCDRVGRPRCRFEIGRMASPALVEGETGA